MPSGQCAEMWCRYLTGVPSLNPGSRTFPDPIPFFPTSLPVSDLSQNEVVRCNSFALSLELTHPVYGYSHMCQMLVKIVIIIQKERSLLTIDFIRVVFCSCIFSKTSGHTHERSSFTLKIIDVTSKYTCTSLVIAIYVICWQHYAVMLNYLKQPNEFTRYLTFGDLNQAKVYRNLN